MTTQHYQDFYLKFVDEAEAESVLYRVEGVTEGDPENGVEPSEGYRLSNYRNIDILGTLYKNDATLDEEGNVISPPTTIDGWHVNIRALSDEDTSVLEPFRVDPEPVTWRRVWAG